MVRELVVMEADKVADIVVDEVADMEVDKAADKVADMVADKKILADMELDMVDDMEVDKVSGMVADMMAVKEKIDININMEIQFGGQSACPRWAVSDFPRISNTISRPSYLMTTMHADTDKYKCKVLGKPNVCFICEKQRVQGFQIIR